jgi:membrane-associated HD superfamily phosphohydrolase
MADVVVWSLLGLGLAGLVGVMFALGFLTQNKDNGAEIKKNLGIISGVTGVLVFIFGAVAYMYFTTNVNYLTPFLLIMTFVNLLLSLVAVSAASLSVSYS